MLRTMDNLLIKLSMLEGQAGKIAQAPYRFPSRVVSQRMVAVEHRDHSSRFSRGGVQRRRQAELDPGFQYLPERRTTQNRVAVRLGTRDPAQSPRCAPVPGGSSAGHLVDTPGDARQTCLGLNVQHRSQKDCNPLRGIQRHEGISDSLHSQGERLVAENGRKYLAKLKGSLF